LATGVNPLENTKVTVGQAAGGIAFHSWRMGGRKKLIMRIADGFAVSLRERVHYGIVKTAFLVYSHLRAGFRVIRGKIFLFYGNFPLRSGV
jgi:hypothetical protein